MYYSVLATKMWMVQATYGNPLKKVPSDSALRRAVLDTGLLILVFSFLLLLLGNSGLNTQLHSLATAKDLVANISVCNYNPVLYYSSVIQFF